MQRVVTYLYPREDLASGLKVFQDRTNQVKGFFFTRENVKEVEKLTGGKDYAVYFLFNQTEEDEMKKVYIGQSKNGASRIQNHRRNKMFWSHGLMFVSDNSGFDVSTIDYLEYYFVNRFKDDGQYLLDNEDLRTIEPNVSAYDLPTIQSYSKQIEFLLKAEGVDLDIEERVGDLAGDEITFYYPNNNSYQAKIFHQNGQLFLAKGSVVQRPHEQTQEYSDGGRFFERATRNIEDPLREGKLEVFGDKYKTNANLAINSLSAIASMVTGQPANGWNFFKDVNELRQ